jgi:hypothetical protein
MPRLPSKRRRLLTVELITRLQERLRRAEVVGRPLTKDLLNDIKKLLYEETALFTKDHPELRDDPIEMTFEQEFGRIRFKPVEKP